MKRTVVLAILDGWGIGQRDFSNPIYSAKPPTISEIKHKYPIGALQSAGIAVGLPWNEEGNSEVGHLTIGAGKVLYQHYPRITLAIQSGEFAKNKVFLSAFEHTKKNNSALNLIGLLTEGNIHASFEHLDALISLAKKNGIKKLNLHLFSDGKDSRPHSVVNLVAKLKGVLDREGLGQLVSISGRKFGLDRDGHWQRTESAYRVMTTAGPASAESLEIIANRTYEEGENDDGLAPTILVSDGQIRDNDSLIFVDFREDSIRQIASAFILKDFDKFKIAPLKNLHIATLTEYSDRFKVPVAFPNEDVTNPLGKALSEAGKTQMLVAETEKYAHVTYFFNGFRDENFKNQFPVLIPSRNVARHDEHPEMMAEEIANRVVEAIEDKSFDFILVNFANPDMIAHTGNFSAAVKAIEVVDRQVNRLMKACEATGAALIITSDHGNVERMVDPLTGAIETSHDVNAVPIYLIANEFARAKTDAEATEAEQEVVGLLSDVAPTVLDLMGIKIPKDMTGKSLVKFLR